MPPLTAPRSAVVWAKLEAQLCELLWEKVRAGVEVKLLPQDGKVYLLAQSRDRAFFASCLPVTLHRRWRDLAPGITPRSVIEKFAAVQMVDVPLPASDRRTVIMPRYTQPEKELKILLSKNGAAPQPSPRIPSPGSWLHSFAGVQTF